MATSHLYIQSWIGWTNVEKIVLESEHQIVKHGQPYTVINSTNNVYDKPNWVNSGDHWYFVSFYRALQEFNQKANYFVFVSGDFKCKSWSILLDRMNSVLDNKVGSYSPYTIETIITPEKVGLKQLDENLDYSICQEGVMVAYRKDIAQELLEFFDFASQEINLYELKYGWGVDYIAAVLCMNKGLYMLKDKSIEADNSSSRYYEGFDTPIKEMNTILDLFVKFKGKQVKPLLDKIRERMEDNSPSFNNTKHMTLDDFYS
jgi:hypothetical protein